MIVSVASAAMEAVIQRLTGRFPQVSAETVQLAVRGECEDYNTSAARDFVPILVEPAVRTQLARHRA
jgi:hypothetical protein